MSRTRLLCLFTVVMNRLHHLSQTLPVNMKTNTDAFTKFLILDYNSSDGLREYVLGQFGEEIKSGRLEYHRYEDARYFSHSHSRNLAVKLAATPFVCNVDADNFTGPDFDKFLLKTFASEQKAVISALSNELNIYGAFGRMATRTNDFSAVGGFDETFEGYGFEDYDLVSRLEESGLKKITINDPRFLQSLPHGNSERISCEWTANQLHSVYRQQVNDALQVLLYLFKDNSMHYGVVNEDFSAGVHYRYTLAGNNWQKGTWKIADDKLELKFEGFDAAFVRDGQYLTGNNHRMKVEADPLKMEEAILFHTNMANCCLYLRNKNNSRIRVNENGFGMGKTEKLVIH